uniref:Acetylglutamate kinase n=1 Tax=Crouania attenuata TaxID=42002 RepID=A0A4D6WPX7_9FLOR|nr:acetylglutamate kinase [Crouania attenuata]
MLNNLRDLKSLSNITPFINNYSGKIFVVKYGGSVMKNEKLQIQFIKDIYFLSSIGIKVVLVHGGGPFINDWLNKLSIEPKFENGIRITDFETMKIVEMVLIGQVNKTLVSLMNTFPVNAIGISGKDANLVVASKLFDSSHNFVGKVDSVNINILNLLLDNHYLPIIASVSSDIYGQSYNINADTFASILSVYLGANKLILVTDTDGVMLDISDSTTLISHLTCPKISKLKRDNVICGGMIPKVDSCVDAVSNGVFSAHIINGNINHSLLIELFTDKRCGSMVTI